MKRQKKYLVYSYCDDQHQTFVDLVMANDEVHACNKVCVFRDYAVIDTDATETVDDHLEQAIKMSKLSPAQVRDAWERLKKNAC
jgi:hypothetical protein